MNFKERFPEKKYPVCKPYPHQPDIKLGFQEKAGAYRLFCKNCDARAQNAIPHVELSKEEKENAEELGSKKNRKPLPPIGVVVCSTT